MFDWLEFFDRHGIEYDAAGPNVSRGHVVVHCPFCGTEDHGRHLSVHLGGRGWRCWRRGKAHSGKSPVRLVMALTGCSLDAARQLAGGARALPDDFLSSVRAAMGRDAPTEGEERELSLPAEFLPFDARRASRPFLRYLTGRGFSNAQVARMTRRSGLRFATAGLFHGRIIFPVVDRGRLVSWTGRTISARNDLRYLSLTHDEESAAEKGVEPALGPISDYVLWRDRLAEADADTFVLVEGPFDALKVDVLGRKHGIVATCCFTAAPSDAQLDILADLLPRFRRRFLLLDRGTIATAMRVLADAQGLGLRFLRLPDGYKDPGDLDSRAFSALFRVGGA